MKTRPQLIAIIKNNLSYIALLIFLIISQNWVAVGCWVVVGIEEQRTKAHADKIKDLEKLNEQFYQESLDANADRNYWCEKYMEEVYRQEQLISEVHSN